MTENQFLVRRALEEIQEALDLLNLPLKEQKRPYTIIGALEEARALMRSAKAMLNEVGWESNMPQCDALYADSLTGRNEHD